MQNHSSTMQLNSPISSENLMQSRLGALCLQSIDVGGAGDCFFRSVSHQLYGNSNHHMHIRTAGVQFMRDNPERFIESNTENSWLRYLKNMCIQGTCRPVTRILYGGVLTRPKWTKLPKCILYCLIRLFRKVAIHEKLQRQSTQ